MPSTRKCTITEYERGVNGNPTTIKRQWEGKFHCFSSDFVEFESGPGNNPIAIVEDTAGVVRVVDLSAWGNPTIQFND